MGVYLDWGGEVYRDIGSGEDREGEDVVFKKIIVYV